MDRDAYLDSLRADRARFAGAVGLDVSVLGTTVPACPDWTLQDLLVHLGRVHRWAMDAARLAPDATFPRLGPRPDEGTDPAAWVVDGLDELIADFATMDLDEPCWTFAGPGTRRFWLRRQAMETAVHRVDAQSVLGTGDPVDPEIAADGVDEWLDLQATRWYKAHPDIVGTLHLHATDDGEGSSEWFVQVDPARLGWHHGHHKGDVAVRAGRADLFLMAWRRRRPDELDVVGDAALLEAFLHQTQVS
jgi:uncharacterized protein (TIGR03083 family)